jgi:hypothetical protein
VVPVTTVVGARVGKFFKKKKKKKNWGNENWELELGGGQGPKLKRFNPDASLVEKKKRGLRLGTIENDKKYLVLIDKTSQYQVLSKKRSLNPTLSFAVSWQRSASWWAALAFPTPRFHHT